MKRKRLQVALLPVRGSSQIISDIGQTHQQRNQEGTGDQNDPPAAGEQGLFRKRQHTAPGNNFQGKTHAHKAQGGFGADGPPDIHDHHEHNGGNEIGGQVLS